MVTKIDKCPWFKVSSCVHLAFGFLSLALRRGLCRLCPSLLSHNPGLVIFETKNKHNALTSINKNQRVHAKKLQAKMEMQGGVQAGAGIHEFQTASQ
eukprot:m.9260 g.9260  ORF g.9260 m.9260 type:complete len:97 (-) comp5436_c0_seq3:27-317(-)